MNSNKKKGALAVGLALTLALALVTIAMAAIWTKTVNFNLVYAPPPSDSYVPSISKGYTEGDVASFRIEVTGDEGVDYQIQVCVDYHVGNKAYFFKDFAPPYTDFDVSHINSTFGLPLYGSPYTETVAGVGAIISSTQVIGVIGDGTIVYTPTSGMILCDDRYLGMEIHYSIDNGVGPADEENVTAYILYGSTLFKPGDVVGVDPLNPRWISSNDFDYTPGAVTDLDSPSDNNGTSQQRVKSVGVGDKTVNFNAGAITPAEVDLAVTKFCPANEDFLNQDPPYTFQIEVVNLGPADAENVVMTDTLDANISLFPTPPTPGWYSSSESDGTDGGTCTYDDVNHEVICTTADLIYTTDPVTWTVTLSFTVDVPGSLSNEVIVDNDVTDTDPNNNFDSCDRTTPVTLAQFSSSQEGAVVRFDWSTATEVGNAGFNLYAETPEGREKVNDQLIPSNVIDSLEPQSYSYEAATSGDVFFIEDVAVNTETRLHGPFNLGEAYGSPPVVEAIDWGAIRAEVGAEAEPSGPEPLTFTAPQPAEAPALPDSGYTVLMPLVLRAPPAGISYPTVNLAVDQDGLYRVTYEQLLAAGFDFRGATPSDIALTNQGYAVSIYVDGSIYFGPGDYIEFYGEAIDTLYTNTNVYTLQVDSSKAWQATTDFSSPDEGAQTATFYMETAIAENDVAYSPASLNGDPWYDTRLFVWTSSDTWTFNVDVDNLSSGADSTLSVDMWGMTSWPDQSPDHHVVVQFNGESVADETFDGSINKPINATLPEGAVVEGTNTLALTLPGDTGADYDIVAYDGFSVTYPRAFVAVNGALEFSSAASAFSVDGLTSADVVVYRLDGGSLVKLDNVDVAPSENGFSAAFAGSGAQATYLVYSTGSLLIAGLEAPREAVDITSGSADYLVISHSHFISGLDPLVSARQAQGLSVRVVDVDDVYAQFGDGIFDPLAIKKYIRHAIQYMGTDYILLVGGDTYDYFDNEGEGSLSFIPSLYAPTDKWVKFAPVDPFYTDVNGDFTPDAALGRFPVRTTGELSTLVSKTLAYQNKDYAGTALLAADKLDGSIDFKADSQLFAQQMPQSWNITEAYIDDLGVSTARTTLLQALNNGVALASYVGHSSQSIWSNLNLFNSNDAAALTNNGRPAVVTQWGCWNTYYVNPNYNSLGHKFLLSGDQGAAAVLGAATLTRSESEEALGVAMMPALTQSGTTIGDAMLAAKQQLAQSKYQYLDVILGWTILGDPALVIQP
jgi:uncharacterized repeat protein (TIGR01451 family)